MKTYVYLENESNNFINSLIENKENFILKQTNYSDEIVWRGDRYLINNKGYMSFDVLKFRSKILSDIKKFKEKNTEPRKVDKLKIQYFDLGKFWAKSGNFDDSDLFCIDIKSAYPQTFLNRGYITEKTFNEMQSANKEARLKGCGSIATEKIIFTFEGGVSISAELKKSETENYFFTVVNDVSYLMSKIKSMLKNDFLFYWVDGIFFKGDYNINLITDVLKLNGYKFSIETIDEISVNRNKRHLVINLVKSGKNKIFNLPLVKKKRIKFAYNK